MPTLIPQYSSDEIKMNGDAVVKVVDEGVVFKSDADEFLIPNESIISVETGEGHDLNLILFENQIIRIKFDIAGVWSYAENKAIVEEYFIYNVSQQATGMDYIGDKSSGSYCPECGTLLDENKTFCINCGRQINL